jgi:hypothetical protein
VHGLLLPADIHKHDCVPRSFECMVLWSRRPATAAWGHLTSPPAHRALPASPDCPSHLHQLLAIHGCLQGWSRASSEPVQARSCGCLACSTLTAAPWTITDAKGLHTGRDQGQNKAVLELYQTLPCCSCAA